MFMGCSKNRIKYGVDASLIRDISTENNQSLTMNEKDVLEKFGHPSFIISEESSEKINDNNLIYSNWYYVYYELEPNHISKNHKVSKSKIAVFRFLKNGKLMSCRIFEH